MKTYTENEPVFSESIQITETSDPAHADNINAAPMQLLQNSLVNHKEIEELKQGNNEVEFDDTGTGSGTDIPGGGEEPGEIPDPAEALEQITSGKSVPTLIGHIKRTLMGLLPLSQRALNIAMGKNQARVFATVEALDAWLSVPEHAAELKVGDNFYITATDVPDYWWDGSAKQELEVQKVDLTAYDRKIAALEAKDSELNGNITALQTLMESFNQAKSRIISSALGKALGMVVSTSLADIAAKLASVANRGTLNWSGNNTTFVVPAGYYSGGTLDSRGSYNNGYNAGVAVGKDTSFNLIQSGTAYDDSDIPNRQITYKATTKCIFVAWGCGTTNAQPDITKNNTAISPTAGYSARGKSNAMWLIKLNPNDVIVFTFLRSGSGHTSIAGYGVFTN